MCRRSPVCRWDSSATCDNSCHILQVLQEISPGAKCPLPLGSLKVTPCSSGSLCEPIKVAKVVQVSLKGPSKSDARSGTGKQLFIRGESASSSGSERSPAASVEEAVGPALGSSPAATVISWPVKSSRTESQRFAHSQMKARAKLPNHASRLMRKSDMPVVSGVAGTTPQIASSDVSLLFDRDVTTAIEFSSPDSSSFAVYFSGGGDIHEFSAVFLLDSDRWEEGLRLSCAAYDRFGKALVVREGFIGRLPPRNFLKPAGVNVSYWQWTNVRLFGVQAVQCTSGSPSLLPSSTVPLAASHSPLFPSSSSSPFLPASSTTSSPRSHQDWSLPDRRAAGFLSSSPPACERGELIHPKANLTTVTPPAPRKSPSSSSPASSLPPLRVAELIVLGRPNGGGACPPEGFFSHTNCPSEASRPVFDLATLDCKGEWSEWAVCDASCTSLRVFRKRKEAAWGGRPCQRIQKRPCGEHSRWCYNGGSTGAGAPTEVALAKIGPTERAFATVTAVTTCPLLLWSILAAVAAAFDDFLA